jgi:hypothetical protein
MIDTNCQTPTRAEHRGSVTPGRKAYAAMLLQAYNDYIRPIRNKRPDMVFQIQLDKIEAHLWFASKREDYEFDFERVAAGLGMSAGAFRRKLGIQVTDNLFGWKDLSPRESEGCLTA